MQKTDARQSAAAGESKLHFLDYWRVIRVRFGIVVLTFLLVVITTGLSTYLLPKKYRRRRRSMRDPRSDPSLTRVCVPRWRNARTLVSRRRSSRSCKARTCFIRWLSRAWRRLGRPMVQQTRENAYYKLRGMMALKPVRGTDLVEVSVTSTDPRSGKARQRGDAVLSRIVRSVGPRVSPDETRPRTGDEEHSRQKADDLLKKLAADAQGPAIEDPDPDTTACRRTRLRIW